MIAAALVVLFGAALVLVAAPSRFRGRPAALFGATASAAAFVLLAVVPRDDVDTTWGEVDVAWIEPLGARLHLGMDGVSWPLALLTAFLTLLCCLWLLKPDTSPLLVALLLVVAGASIGVFVSMDLLLFFIFFELALIPMWFVIAKWGAGGDAARRAATRFLLFTVTGSALLLVGIVVIALKAGTLQIDEIRGTESLLAASLIALGLAVKVPLVPLHTWLPDAHGRAPTVGSVLLAGVFLKLGTYGLLRLDVQMLPESTARIAPVLGVVAVAGIVWAGLACLVQDDLKRLVAYSSIGHMGFVVLGLATLSRTGIAAAVFGSVAHGLITGLLFFLAGSLKERYGTASLRELGRGLYERAPWRAVAILVGGLATMGLPGFAGFWGELLALRAAYEPNLGLDDRALAWTLLGVATAGIALATAYVVRFARSLLQGEPTPVAADADLVRREVVVAVALVLPIVVLGLAPTLITDLLGAGVMGAVNIPFDWVAAGPATLVVTGAVIGLLVDAFAPRRTWLGAALPTLAGTLAGGAELLRTGSIDDIAFGFSLVVLVGTVLVVVASVVMNVENAMPAGEFHVLLGSAAAGGLVMASARDLVTLVVAIELLALPSIALVGLRQGDRRAISASWTFFLTSVVSTAVTLMGVALLYGSTGTLSYAGLSRALEDPAVPGPVVSVAVVLTVVGLLFKLGAVPFHVWVPDTYRGASVMVAGFLASVSKAAALGALLVLLALGLGPADDAWQPVIAVVAAASMTIGNLGALRQRDGVAMLAWSSVAQAGFLIAPAAAIFTASGLSAPLQYLAVYALANLVGFAALAVVLRTRGSTAYDELAGLARTDPWLGIPLAFALLTLAGFPPAVVGLVTKYVVLRPVVDGDVTWLAIVMSVNVMLGLAYYLRLVVVVVGPARGEPYKRTASPYPVHLAVGVVVVGTLALVALSAWPDLLIANLP